MVKAYEVGATNGSVGVGEANSIDVEAVTGTILPQTRCAKLPEMVQHGRNLLRLYQIAYALFLPDFQRQLTEGLLANNIVDGLPEEMRTRLQIEMRCRSALCAISVLEQRLFLGERLLRDTDATSMAASLEVRLPLVDSVLFENVGRLDYSDRYYPLGKKSVLRKSGLHGLDPGLFGQPTTCFVLPYDR